MSATDPVRGIRQPIQAGTLLGRIASGLGPASAIPLATIARAIASAVPPGSLFGAIPARNVVANIGSSANVPAGVTVTSLIDATLGSTQGDVLFRNGTVWTVLHPGTAGNVLSTGGAGANPSWIAPASGTVTGVSVVSANGFAGTVATSTTTPAITLTTTITGILSGNGTAISAAAATGTGNVVLANSPILVTPALGTPASGVLTNCTGNASGLGAGSINISATTTNATFYPLISSAATGFNAVQSTSGKLTFNPSTGVLGVGGLTSSGLISPTSTIGIAGTSTNDNTQAGTVGEVMTISVAVGSAVSLTTATPISITSLILTAGDWDVFGSIGFNGDGSTSAVVMTGCFSTSDNTLDALYEERASIGTAAGFSPFSQLPVAMAIPQRRFLLSAGTTVYLVAYSQFSGGACTAFGRLTARRRR